jgi:hypothetical protein
MVMIAEPSAVTPRLSCPYQFRSLVIDFGCRIAHKPELVTCDSDGCGAGVYQSGAVREPEKPGDLTGQFLNKNRLFPSKVVERYAVVVTGLVKPAFSDANQLAVRRP